MSLNIPIMTDEQLLKLASDHSLPLAERFVLLTISMSYLVKTLMWSLCYEH